MYGKVTHVSEIGTFIDDHFDTVVDAYAYFALCASADATLFASLHLNGTLILAHVKDRLIHNSRTTTR
jgi:phosphatidylglycerophosphate synthase